MALYGQQIGNVNMQQLAMRSYFAFYFDNPVMKKIKDIDTVQVMYGCKVKSMLLRGTKYIIAIINKTTTQPLETVRMDELEWFSLQLRVLDDVFNVPTHVYTPKSDAISGDRITVYKKTDSMYCYNTNRGIDIALLYNKNQTRTFSDTGTIGIALETFNTVIGFVI